MSYKTVEVELENGRVRPSGSETLPAKARALLTLLDSVTLTPAVQTCGELAERWSQLERLASDEANAFADDIEHARTTLPPLKPAWD